MRNVGARIRWAIRTSNCTGATGCVAFEQIHRAGHSIELSITQRKVVPQASCHDCAENRNPHHRWYGGAEAGKSDQCSGEEKVSLHERRAKLPNDQVNRRAAPGARQVEATNRRVRLNAGLAVIVLAIQV
jgi:hypothetical protein